MAEYIRDYPDAPTEEEIKTGYAPSTITASPFLKFLFWTFAGLAITYFIAYGVYLALDKVQVMEDAHYARLSSRQKEVFTGPQLQPSPGHESLDFDDMESLTKTYSVQLKSKSLWQDDPQKLSTGRPGISDRAVSEGAVVLRGWGK